MFEETLIFIKTYKDTFDHFMGKGVEKFKEGGKVSGVARNEKEGRGRKANPCSDLSCLVMRAILFNSRPR